MLNTVRSPSKGGVGANMAASPAARICLATKRARQIARGGEPLVEESNDKSTVIALREIAEGKVTPAFMAEREAAERAHAELLEGIDGDEELADPMA